ncbi:MAG: winged helix-turn-helix domain-containing protein [Acidithiobacillus sp.]|nr:winged helix-turn-helix domain-containing protein [Acidithiobacillus sp.]
MRISFCPVDTGHGAGSDHPPFRPGRVPDDRPEKFLRSLGFSVQKPAYRAWQQDQDAALVARWESEAMHDNPSTSLPIAKLGGGLP